MKRLGFRIRNGQFITPCPHFPDFPIGGYFCSNCRYYEGEENNLILCGYKSERK